MYLRYISTNAARGRADRRERGGVGLHEQPLPDDVVRLVGGRRPPLVGDAAHDVLQALERLEAVRAADLLGVAGDDLVASSPLSDAGIEMASSTPGVPFDGLGQRLREGELVVERAAREVVATDEASARRRPTRRSG